ncbi:late embryogenesis abundant protein-related / LEA protein-related [Raphanus sativus]|uniref:Extensin-like n=1 Tax=Raphanus sativus TaxID=3726 RepID=A0A6J0JKT2_RAPSA|nr:extensin-like [Raphanus sativus]KAJ4886928.1 late embryogenesis abundant protein-related / LEA protein-related [Raphanus sativus]
MDLAKHTTLQMLGCILLASLVLTMAQPPGLTKPSHATCKIKKYKHCYNLEHVCPKFCPDTCHVECVSCKPICGPSSPGDDGGDTPPAPVPPVSPPPPVPVPPVSPPPPVTPTPSYPTPTPMPPAPVPPVSPPPPAPVPPVSPPPPAPVPPVSPPPPVTPTPYPTPTPMPPAPVPPVSPPPPAPVPPVSPPPPTPTPSVPIPTPPVSPPPPSPTPAVPSPTPPSSPPPPSPTPAVPSPTPPSSPPPPSPTPAVPTPPDVTPTPPTPAVPSPPDVTPTPPTPSVPSPDTPTPPVPPYSPPATPTPSVPSPTPTPPSSPTPPGSTPATPSPSVPVPSAPNSPPYVPPSSPTPTPPSDGEAGAGVRRARCKKKGSPCYGVEYSCPAACPRSCEVDCVTCKPLCNCDKPGSVCQDPRFIGGDGLTFYFHGKKDSNFCLISDPNLHINAHFIGKRRPGMARDFTWVQSIAILFGTHRFYVGALKTATWDDSVDRISASFDGNVISLPQLDGATWTSSPGVYPQVSVKRVNADTNNIEVEIEGLLKITARVVSITMEDSRIHGYDVKEDDCLAHLDLGFKFQDLSDNVDGVLGQTYRPNYVSRVKIGVHMPVMGGDREFQTTGLFAPDCSAARFTGNGDRNGGWSKMELPEMSCASGVGGKGVVCKR